MGVEEEKKTRRETINLQKRETPRQITLPNGETFVARYERRSRQTLPKNITVRQRRQKGPKNQQKSHAQLHINVTVRQTQKSVSFLSSGLEKLGNLGRKVEVKNPFKKGLVIASRALTSEIGQKLIEEGIKHSPELYRIDIPKIENSNLKKSLKSDVQNYIVEETRKKEKKKRKSK